MHIYQPNKKTRVKRVSSKRRIYLRRFGKPLKSFLFLVACFGFFLTFRDVFIQSDYFKVKTIKVFGAHTFVSRSDIEVLANEKLLGKNILSLDVGSAEYSLEEAFLGAKEIKIKKKLPSTVEISITERVPLALVSNESNAEFFMVDEQGYVLGIVSSEYKDLPRINYSGELQVGYFIDHTLVPVYLELISSLNDNKLSASTVSIDEHAINFYLDDKILVFLGRSKDVSNAVRVVTALTNQLKIEGKNISRIDLRYDKVIVE